MNRGQVRFLNAKTTDLEWYYSRHNQKLKFLISNFLFVPFVKKKPSTANQSVLVRTE